MQLKNPLIIKFQQGNGELTFDNNTLTVPAFTQWNQFKNATNKLIHDPNYDYAVVSYRDISKEDLDNEKVFKSLDIKTNYFLKEASNQGLRVFNRYNNQMYFLNPTFDEKKASKNYAPSDDVVLNKRNQYPDDYDWQHHQANILKRFSYQMPLTSGQPYESTNHTKMLTAPNRGLSKDQLDGFFSWKSNHIIVPELMQDDMIGMPSVKASSFNDFSLFVGDKQVPSKPLMLQTIGLQGAMIPMRNPKGDSAKYQIATDISPINIVLKARAKDGVSIQKSEYYDKHQGKLGEYKFLMDGKPSHLTVESADNDGVTMIDDKGTFDVNLKQDIKPLLINRGYEIPELIDNIKPMANSKYIWMSKGTMIGSNKINDTNNPENNRISPSIAGFMTAKEPIKGSDEYVVLVAEGALKGVITANYLTQKDENGKSVADLIAGDRGIIVAQVPGVASAFVKSVDRIYTEKNVIGTYIAMDADGRENLSVAKGIHSAYEELSQHSPVKVMSWDPAQKGIDDALIAVARHQITVDDMKIHFGTPDKLFPLDKASAPNPYKLDGTRANKLGWVQEYAESKKEQAKKIKNIQENSDDLNLSMDDLQENQPINQF